MRALNRLSARFVATASTPGYYPDGGGLYLQVAASGAKTWIFRYRYNGRRPEMGLGPLHTIGLAEARQAALVARRQLIEGIDPMTARRAAQAARAAIPTFGKAAASYIEAHRDTWRNPKHATQWENTLATHAAKLTDLPIDRIDTPDVVAVLKPIWLSIPETAGRLRGRIEAVLDAETVKHHRSGPNPARWKGHLEHLLPPLPKLTKGHLVALPYQELPAFMAKLRNEQGTAARALEWLILHANRPNETRFASREEIVGDEWHIPADRMKGKRLHVVPLTKASTALLEQLPAYGLLFPLPYGDNGALSENAMTALIKRMGYKDRATAHGFRSSFKDWASEETEFANEVSEMALAHKIKDKAEAAYRRGKLLSKRRELMESWARFCGSMPE
ncbi:MAG: tyrosine-type recombinase/integrase [Pseudomonadota bacterium]